MYTDSQDFVQMLANCTFDIGVNGNHLLRL